MSNEESGDWIQTLHVATGIDLDTGVKCIQLRINDEAMATFPPEVARNLGIALIEAADELTKPN